MKFFSIKIVVAILLFLVSSIQAEDELFLQASENNEIEESDTNDDQLNPDSEEIKDEKDQAAEEKKFKELVCTPGCKAALGASGAAATIGAVFAIPMAMGFGASGIVAGSTAAGI